MSKFYFIFATSLLILLAAWTSSTPFSTELVDQESVYEIRNYNIHPDQLEAYKTWITNLGLPYIRTHTNVVGFWIEGDNESEVNGAPLDELGSANVTWVIQWDSMDQRNETMERVFSTPEWQEIFAQFPGGSEAYLRVEIKYFDGI